MKPFKNTFCIILPNFGRNKRVFGIDFETVVPYSVKQFASASYKRNCIDVSKGLTILETFPYNLSYMMKFMSFFFLANK